MLSIAIVCGAGASSSFLARRLNDLSRNDGRGWTFSPRTLDLVDSTQFDLVAVSHHVASESVLSDLADRGVVFVALPETVRGGFGADDALTVISQFIDENVTTPNASRAFADVQGHRP